MKMYPEVKALKDGYISLQNLLSLPSLMCLGLMIAFSCTAFTGRVRRNRNRSIFSLTKTHPCWIKETLADAHASAVWQRTEPALFFPRGVDSGGEECQHLCWGYFLFYSCFLRDASECCGERAHGLGCSANLSTSYLSTWGGDTKPDIVSKSSHHKLIKRQCCVFSVLFAVSFCSYSIHVYDSALVYKSCSHDRMPGIWLLYKYPQ